MGFQQDKEILIINDFTGYGRVSTVAMIPVFSYYGLHTYSLPTSLLSNTLDYPEHELIDTTDFMRKTVKTWERLGFSFRNICTGFINSDEQVDIIENLIDSQNTELVLIDPIMGDNGELYSGVYDNITECNRRLAARADIFVPNITEARLLTGLFSSDAPSSSGEYTLLAKALLDLGAKSVVLKGCQDPGCGFCNIICEAPGSVIRIPYEQVDTQFVGTGDIFSAVLMSEVVSGTSLAGAVKTASSFITEVLKRSLDNPDHFDIHYEGFLPFLPLINK